MGKSDAMASAPATMSDDMPSMVCAHCGRSWPGDVWQGLCPRCLARRALAGLAGPVPEEGAGRNEATTEPRAAPDGAGIGVGVRMGDFELMEEVARGGMGVVYRARQISVDRVVAVKVLPAGGGGTRGMLERFRRESRAVGTLRHRHIVTVHAAGEWQGWPFLAMEYIGGGTLAGAVRERSPTVSQAIEWTRAIADAVEHAHGQGVVHRDLKPSNILLDASGEPRVSDFGLSRWLAEETELTLTGQVLGSPGYLPPERLSGRGEGHDIAGDVYGVGAILYYLLCGRPPFVGTDVESVLIQALGNEVPRPRLFHPTIPRDLEAVVLKCLEREPRHRFGSVGDLREELDRMRRGEVVRTRPAGWVRWSWLWCRRHAARATLLGASLAFLGVGGGLTFWQWRRAEGNARELAATVQRLRLDQASERLENERASEGLAMLARLLREDPGNRVAAQRVASVLRQREFLHPLPGELALAHARWTSPFARHGDRIAAGTNASRALRIWNLSREPELEREIALDGVARVSGFSREGEAIVVVTHEGALTVHAVGDGSRRAGPYRVEGLAERVGLSPTSDLAWVVAVPDQGSDNWRRASGRVIRLSDGQRVHADVPFHHADYSPDGEWVVTSSEGQATVRRASTWEAVGRPLTDASRVYGGSFSPDSARVVTAGADSNASVWRATTGERLLRLGHPVNVDYAFFSPDGQRVFTHDVAGNGRLWDASSGQLVGGPFAANRNHGPTSFSPDGSRFVCEAGNGLLLRDGVTGTPLTESITLADNAAMSRFLGDGRRVFVAEFSGRARVWTTSHSPRAIVFRDTLGLNDSRLSPEGTRVATANKGSRARLWRVRDGARIGTDLVHDRAVTSIKWNPTGDRVLSASDDHTARLWDGATGAAIGAPMRHDGVVCEAHFSPDGRWIATASEDGTVQLWDGRTAAAQGPRWRHESPARHVCFSPDGRLVASMTRGRRWRLWSVPEGRLEAEQAGGEWEGESVVFHPDGRSLLTFGGSPVLRTWTWQGTPRKGPEARQATHVRGISFSSDGALLLLSSLDGWARVLDANTLEARGRAMPHASGLNWAGFSPDDRWILTVSVDGTARLWDTATAQPVSDAYRHREFAASGQWARDGKTFLTASYDRTSVLWPVWFVPGGPVPSWLPDLAEAAAGRRQIAADEQFGALRVSELVDIHRRLSGIRDDGPWGSWLRAWYSGHP